MSRPGEVSSPHRRATIAIVVGRVHAHARLGFAVGTVGHPGFDADVRERAVVVVLVKDREVESSAT